MSNEHETTVSLLAVGSCFMPLASYFIPWLWTKSFDKSCEVIIQPSFDNVEVSHVLLAGFQFDGEYYKFIILNRCQALPAFHILEIIFIYADVEN